MKKLFVAMALVLLATAVAQAQNVPSDSIYGKYLEKKAQQDAERRQREAEQRRRNAGTEQPRMCKSPCTGQMQSCEMLADPNNCR